MVQRLSFDAHGKRRLADWTAGAPADPDAETPRGFTGHEHLDSVGLIHMNGRVYDPTLGRFLSADPLVPNPTATQSFNRYSYVSNNPLSFTDPSGFFGLGDVADAIGDAIGTAIGAIGDAIGAIGDAIGAIGEAIGGPIGAIGVAIGNVLGAIGAVVGAIGEQLGGVIGAGVVGGIIGALGGPYGVLGGAALGMIGYGAGKVHAGFDSQEQGDLNFGGGHEGSGRADGLVLASCDDCNIDDVDPFGFFGHDGRDMGWDGFVGMGQGIVQSGIDTAFALAYYWAGRPDLGANAFFFGEGSPQVFGPPVNEDQAEGRMIGPIAGGMVGSIAGGARSLARSTAKAIAPAAPRYVYRGGSNSIQNLTPRPSDTTGLSTFDNPEAAMLRSKKAQVIDTTKLSQLSATPDAPPPGHVSIAPRTAEELAEWSGTRGTDTEHPFSREVLNAIVDEVRRK